MTLEFLSPELAIALAAYLVGVASPGPSNMAIMSAAMSQGRRQALVLAFGITCGSLLWGLATALGMSVLMRTYAWGINTIKIVGGTYLFYLAWRAARAAMTADSAHLTLRAVPKAMWRSFGGGLAMHLTNPKAVLVWLSIVALAVRPGANRTDAFTVVACCTLVGAGVFSAYAMAFSTATVRTFYSRFHRWLNATLSAAFGAAGARLLLSSSAT